MQNGVLVTGVAGFIGWKTAELLLSQKTPVVGVDDLNPYYDPRLKLWRLENLKRFKEFTFLQGTVEDLKFLKRVFEEHRPAAVINLAARAGVRASIKDPFAYYKTNVEGTLNLLELAKEYGVKKFVLASTSSVYAGSPLPYSEELPVNTPLSPYAASKKAAEVLTYTYHHLYGIDVSVLRYFTVYGPAGRPDMSYFRFIKRIKEGRPVEVYGDGTQARDFTYIDDIAAGTVLALKPVGYQVINLGGGKNPVSINELIKKLENLLGRKAEVRYTDFHSADMKITWAEIGKAKKLLGWEPRVEIDEGLKRTVEWFEANWDLVSSLED